MRTDRRATRLRSNLRASVLDGGAFSFMVGTGETYLPAFVLAVGLGETTAGMIAAAPMLGGAVIQMISPWGVQWMRSLRRWVVFCAVVQTLSLTPLVYFALRGGAPAALIFAAATLYWASGMALSPAWNTWIGSLVPRRLRAHFFGRRVRVTQGCLLTGLISGGLILHHFAEGRREISAFALLFCTAVVARLVSARFLAGRATPRWMSRSIAPCRFRSCFVASPTERTDGSSPISWDFRSPRRSPAPSSILTCSRNSTCRTPCI